MFKNFDILIILLLFSFFVFGCINQEVKPEIKIPTCTIEKEHCVYDEPTNSLSCGSNYGVLSKGNTYWLEECKNITLGPKLLISLFGPFTNEAEYNEFISQSFSKTTTPIDEPAGKYKFYFLYTENGVYKIDNETSKIAVAKKVLGAG